MKSHRAAKAYAKALFELAQEQRQLAAVYSDMKSIALLVHNSNEFAQFLRNPVIPFQKQIEILIDILKNKISSMTFTFVLFLTEKSRLSELVWVWEAFERLYLQTENILTVTVSSVCPLRSDQVQTICEKLQKYFEKDVQAVMAIDPDLLGGFKVQVGDLIYDYSIQTQLKRFKETVMMA